MASNNADDVVDTIDDVLQYIINLYNRYNQQLNFNSKESDYHGFLSGFLMNFRYRHTAGIYLELFVGGWIYRYYFSCTWCTTIDGFCSYYN
ncbi:hypothetical protein IYZ83_000745 [Wolbachia pipientis]|uniref:hypothetical protein n=1 Tax=Wolbachia pipientis TaxID=955 RepID=UPI001F3BBAE2|nr:hypothetical protein [Wolbachia pipientis]UIP91791.1 hypothetical protein IYZ83_000745 [Wolbachia pipientis]